MEEGKMRNFAYILSIVASIMTVLAFFGFQARIVPPSYLQFQQVTPLPPAQISPSRVLRHPV